MYRASSLHVLNHVHTDRTIERKGYAINKSVAECDNEDIRLVGGNDTAGTVEICFGDMWQLVCDDDWGSRDAKVVCRQLGFSPNGQYYM